MGAPVADRGRRHVGPDVVATPQRGEHRLDESRVGGGVDPTGGRQPRLVLETLDSGMRRRTELAVDRDPELVQVQPLLHTLDRNTARALVEVALQLDLLADPTGKLAGVVGENVHAN